VPIQRDSLASQEYEERLRFERLLADLSARFINLPADEVDAEINSAQRQVCECLQVDVSALWQLPPEGSNTLILTHLYSPPDFPPVPETMDAQEHFPWSVGRILEHDRVIWSRLSDAPAEALCDLGTYQHFGLKSVLTLPLSAGGGRVFGALNFSITQKEKDWPPELVNRLELVAQVFANALARKLADQTFRVRHVVALENDDGAFPVRAAVNFSYVLIPVHLERAIGFRLKVWREVFWFGVSLPGRNDDQFHFVFFSPKPAWRCPSALVLAAAVYDNRHLKARVGNLRAANAQI